MALIELSDVTKRYRVGDQEIFALNGVDLSIGQGEYAAIIGPSGSGKSTLMHLLGCLDIPTSGSMVIDGIDVSRASSNGSPKCGIARSASSSRLLTCSPNSRSCKTWSCR